MKTEVKNKYHSALMEHLVEELNHHITDYHIDGYYEVLYVKSWKRHWLWADKIYYLSTCSVGGNVQIYKLQNTFLTGEISE
jgi:hypothetical protein